MNKQHAFERMRAPADEVLASHGIRARKIKRGAAVWLNMERCPACGHKGYQCGVSESIGRNGRLAHGVHCFHPQDNPWNKESIHYADFLARLGAISAGDAEMVKNFEKYDKPSHKNLFNIDTGTKLRKRLFKNQAALAYLHGRGLDDKSIERFFLGLSAEWTHKNTGEKRSDALLCPLRGPDGKLQNRYIHYNIPGVSVNPLNDNGWMKGEVATFYADAIADQTALFICAGVKDLWRHWQELLKHDRLSNLLLVSSTHGTAFPNEWKEAAFWQRWDLVYCGQDNDEAGHDMARRVALLAGREVRRVLTPQKYGKDWTDFWQKGGTIETFQEALDSAAVISQDIVQDAPTGRISFDPIDINGAFHNERLYYPVQTLVREAEKRLDPSGRQVEEIVESLETVVIRSDRTVHTAVSSRPRKGTSKEQLVWRLTDGTLIEAPPRPNTYGTWSWGAIDDYLNRRNKTRALGKMLRDIYRHLYASVWLPYPEDYAVLTLTVPVTYVQAAFEAVPLFIVNGPAGSGKSQLGIAMSQVCANGSVIGQTSAAGIARYIDESRGFVVLDDLESLGAKGNGKEANAFSELAQALKLSYNKSTGVKIWTDVKTMKAEKLNFFGVKFINNTQGVDEILGSRMLHVQTRAMPAEARAEFRERSGLPPARLRALRDELHTWAFENIALVVRKYAELAPDKSDRAEEITAPLKVISALGGDAGIEADFRTAIAMQRRKVIRSVDPVEVLWEALRNLVIQGFAWIMPNHLINEMKSMMPRLYDQQSTTQIAEWRQANWIGRQLRIFDLIDPNIPGKRYRVRGGHLRAFPIHPRVLKEVREWAVEQDVEIRATGSAAPESFCQDCIRCAYCGIGCDMMGNEDARMSKSERLAMRMNYVRANRRQVI